MIKSSGIWFLLGIGYSLQCVASLSLTELFVIVASPLIFLREYHLLRRHGFMPLLLLSVLVFAGCIVSSIANQTPFYFALRGAATTALLPCSIVVSHWILNRDMSGFRWYLLGCAISQVLSIFVLQRSVELVSLAGGDAGADAVEGIMSGPLFWISRLAPFALLIPRGWYLKCPLWLSASLPLGFAAFAMFTTVSGRSTALVTMLAAMFVILGGKTRKSISRIGKNFWIIGGLMAVCSLLLYVAYRYSASTGILGERHREKYEMQSKGSKNPLKLLLGGRMEAFGGLLACVDKPIVGFGPWAMDTKGYTEEFLTKYGEIEDYQRHIETKLFYAKLGYSQLHLIHSHSYIVGFWLWFGIFGLFFWLYAVYILLRHIKSDCYAVPQMFMWVTAGLPSMLWAIVFSPFTERFGAMLMLSACLMIRAVRRNIKRMPLSMQIEIEDYELRHMRRL